MLLGSYVGVFTLIQMISKAAYAFCNDSTSSSGNSCFEPSINTRNGWEHTWTVWRLRAHPKRRPRSAQRTREKGRALAFLWSTWSVPTKRTLSHRDTKAGCPSGEESQHAETPTQWQWARMCTAVLLRFPAWCTDMASLLPTKKFRGGCADTIATLHSHGHWPRLASSLSWQLGIFHFPISKVWNLRNPFPPCSPRCGRFCCSSKTLFFGTLLKSCWNFMVMDLVYESDEGIGSGWVWKVWIGLGTDSSPRPKIEVASVAPQSPKWGRCSVDAMLYIPCLKFDLYRL